MRTILATTLLSLSLAATAADTTTIPVTAQQRQALGIEVAPLEAVAVEHGILLPARVAVPNAQLQVVTAPQEGLVEMLLVAEGQTVHKGQPLVRIQSPRLLELQSDYLETASRHALADSNYRRDRQLSKEGIIAERRLLESRAAYQELSTSLARLQRLLELAGMDGQALEDLKKSRELSSTLLVRAPLDGVVLEQLVTAGKRVEAADPLYRIADVDPLWLEIHVPLAQLGQTAVGQTVSVPDPGITGRIVTIGRMVHSTDQGVLVIAEVSDGAAQLHPGQFLQVQLASRSDTNSFRVPRSAVARAGGRQFIFVAGPDGFTPLPVSVSSEQADGMVVRGDLAPDSRVAVNGAAALKAIWQGEAP